VAENGSDPQLQANLADCYSEIGNVLASTGKPIESLALHDKAKDIQQALIGLRPADLVYQQSFTENLNKIGYAHTVAKDYVAATNAFQEVRTKCESIMNDLAPGPKPVWLLNLLALSQYNIATVHKTEGKIEAAIPYYEKSQDYRTALV